MKKIFPLITLGVFIFVLALIVGHSVVRGAEPLELNLKYSPPCLLQDKFGACNDPTNSFAAYVKRIYQFGLGIAGALALGMIIFGAIRRIVSGGNPTQISEGNSMITSALWGLALLFGSYLILRTINPQLVLLNEPNAPPVSGVPFQYQGASSTIPSDCPVPSQTSCFFDPSKLLANANSPIEAYCDIDSNDVCTAIYRTTEPCNPNIPRQGTDRGGNVINYPSHETAPCKCVNCRAIPANIPTKSGNCNRLFNTKTKQQNLCFLKDGLVGILEGFFNDLRSGNVPEAAPPFRPIGGSIPVGDGTAGGWRLTETFPPTTPHKTIDHYNGAAFDLAPKDGITSVEKCTEAARIAFKLADNYQAVSVVLLEGRVPFSSCEPIFQTVISARSNKISRLAADPQAGVTFHIHVNTSY